jgi:CRISPR-associated protein Csy1
VDDSIQNFLAERKEGWLKTRLKANMSEEEKLALNEEAFEKFSLSNWLPDAAKRANWLSLVSHPSKFSHPGSSTSMVIAESTSNCDGLLRSGHLNVALDVVGNAAALDVDKFLSLKLSDNQSILAHLQQDSEYIKNEFSIPTATYDELAKGFLSVKKQDRTTVTHAKVKQVYFPVGQDYHLLSVLTPSGLVYELTDRIQVLRFSEETKTAREDKKAQRYNPNGFDDLYDLAQIGYGGTKPQNISVLNSQHGGKAYLLQSLPPVLEKRKVRLPKNNFFTEILWAKRYQDSFQRFHKLLIADINTIHIRQGRDRWVLFILDQVLNQVWEIRAQKSGWSNADNYLSLPAHQKIWLDNHFHAERENRDDWLKPIISEFLRWFIDAYEKNLGQQALMLRDDELKYFKNLLKEHGEAFR